MRVRIWSLHLSGCTESSSCPRGGMPPRFRSEASLWAPLSLRTTGVTRYLSPADPVGEPAGSGRGMFGLSSLSRREAEESDCLTRSAHHYTTLLRGQRHGMSEWALYFNASWSIFCIEITRATGNIPSSRIALFGVRAPVWALRLEYGYAAMRSPRN